MIAEAMGNEGEGQNIVMPGAMPGQPLDSMENTDGDREAQIGDHVPALDQIDAFAGEVPEDVDSSDDDDSDEEDIAVSGSFTSGTICNNNVSSIPAYASTFNPEHHEPFLGR